MRESAVAARAKVTDQHNTQHPGLPGFQKTVLDHLLKKTGQHHKKNEAYWPSSISNHIQSVVVPQLQAVQSPFHSQS